MSLFFLPISFLDKKKYLIAFNTYSESAEHPTDSPLPPIHNIIFSLCVAATETGNGECLSKTLLCDSVSKGGGGLGSSGWAGGGEGGGVGGTAVRGMLPAWDA